MRIKSGKGFGEISTLPGSTQVAVLHGSWLPSPLRGKGHGRDAHSERKHYAIEELGYEALLCTVVSTNLPQIAILQKEGWQHLMSFHSDRSGNEVELWGYAPRKSTKRDEPTPDESSTYDKWEESLVRH